METLQLEFSFDQPEEPHSEPAHLIPYWLKRLSAWPSSVFYYRHALNSNGWSMATSGFIFARFCYSRGAITRAEFKRWHRFKRRVKRWSENKS